MEGRGRERRAAETGVAPIREISPDGYPGEGFYQGDRALQLSAYWTAAGGTGALAALS